MLYLHESEPTRSLVAKLLQSLSLSVRKFCAPTNVTTLMADVVVPEVRRNHHSYLRELSGPTFDSI